MSKLNMRRLLLAVLVIVGILQAAFMFLMWMADRAFNRPCDTSHFDTLCGATPTWLLTIQFLVPFVYLLLIGGLARYGFRRLARNPKSMNAGLWGMIGLEVLAVVMWYVLVKPF